MSEFSCGDDLFDWIGIVRDHVLSTMLDDHLRHLFDLYAAGHLAEHALLVEPGPGDWDEQGKPEVTSQSLVDPLAFAPRFEQLLEAGYDWINLSYYGLLEGRPLVVVELPRATVGARLTSVNLSGPSKRVADAGGDALAGIAFRRD